MLTPGRTYSATNSYRYGFNGKENDNEVKREGNSLDFGNRVYDPRIGRFLSIDRMIGKTPFYAPYLFAGDKPIVAIDQNGDLEIIVHVKEIYTDPVTKQVKTFNSTVKLNITTFEDIKGINRTPAEVTITYVNKPIARKDANGFTYVDNSILTSIVDKKNTGQTADESERSNNPIGYYVNIGMKDIAKSMGVWDLTGAATGKDLENGDDLSTTDRSFKLASGVINALTFGRAGAKGELIKWGKDQLIDMGAEKAINLAFEKLGFKGKELAIVSWYVLRATHDASKGDFKKMYDLILKSAELGVKGREAIVEFMRNSYGMDLNMAKDRNEALNKAVTQYLGNSLNSEGQKKLDEYKKDHQ